jgi:hypothetical protein
MRKEVNMLIPCIGEVFDNLQDVCSSSSQEFKMVIDKTTRQDLGVQWDSQTLRIKSVMSGGLVQQWNQTHPGLAMKPGDRIVEANGIRDNVQAIVNECNQNKKCELVVQHVGRLKLEDVAEQLQTVKLPKDLPRKLRLMIQGEKLMDIFSCVIDDEGTMSRGEFVHVICELACSDVSVETMQMLHLLRHIQDGLQKVSVDGGGRRITSGPWTPGESADVGRYLRRAGALEQVDAPRSCPSTPGRDEDFEESDVTEFPERKIDCRQFSSASLVF